RMNTDTVKNTLLLAWVSSYVQNRQDYIHDSARGSYRAWWELQTKDSWEGWSYDSWGRRRECTPQEQVKRLYPHLFPAKKRRRRRRWRSSWRRDRSRATTVSHTEVLPDGEEITTRWKSEHCIYRRDEHPFRERRNKGVKEGRGRREDSFNREEKTRDFRRNDKTPRGGGAKTWAKKFQNRRDRRTV